MFSPNTINTCVLLGKQNNIDPAQILGMGEVESAGKTGSKISLDDPNLGHLNGDMPIIRIEGHYFYRLLSPSKRAVAVSLGYADKKVGGVANPKKQQARYARLAKMANIDFDASIESCSWGIGQVMGEHWPKLKFISARDFYSYLTTAEDPAGAQLDIMVRFIILNHIDKYLRAKDYQGVAYRYNGAGYKANNYDTKIAEASKRWAAYRINADLTNTGPLPVEPPPAANPGVDVMYIGSRGPAVKLLQRHLIKIAKFEIHANHKNQRRVANWAVILNLLTVTDGIYGPNTANAVKQFQWLCGIKVDGIAGVNTLKTISNLLSVINKEPRKSNGSKLSRSAAFPTLHQADRVDTPLDIYNDPSIYKWYGADAAKEILPFAVHTAHTRTPEKKRVTSITLSPLEDVDPMAKKAKAGSVVKPKPVAPPKPIVTPTHEPAPSPVVAPAHEPTPVPTVNTDPAPPPYKPVPTETKANEALTPSKAGWTFLWAAIAMLIAFAIWYFQSTISG